MSEGKPGCCTPSGPRKPLQSVPPTHGGDVPLTPVAETIRHADSGSTQGMVRLPGGPFLMGSESPESWQSDGEGPVREVSVRPFWIDETQVTNAQFAAFVEATGYVTEAQTFGWSFVFKGHLPRKLRERWADRSPPGVRWWIGVPQADWRHPRGHKSDLKGLDDHPAVHVSWNDAVAYCRWAGKRLASEAEWEYAARGGLVQKIYAWGDELEPAGVHKCNIWQGSFPDRDTAADGFAGTCPVRSYEPNGYGLWCVAGNVWEWVGDWFSPTHHKSAARDDPRGPDAGTAKVMRGGSYLCHASYCNRYRVAARTGNTPDSAATNCGFRCVRDV